MYRYIIALTENGNTTYVCGINSNAGTYANTPDISEAAIYDGYIPFEAVEKIIFQYQLNNVVAEKRDPPLALMVDDLCQM